MVEYGTSDGGRESVGENIGGDVGDACGREGFLSMRRAKFKDCIIECKGAKWGWIGQLMDWCLDRSTYCKRPSMVAIRGKIDDDVVVDNDGTIGDGPLSLPRTRRDNNTDLCKSGSWRNVASG